VALAVVASAALAAACAHVPGQEVPDVRSHPDVVVEMLRLAGVGPEDVVYDLGSGDGRIVIAAAHRFGARGVGIEIDPALVAESRRRVAWYGVADRVTIVEGDLFAADLRKATVVTLYLSPDLNRRLRGKLQAELRPGARIVSQRFDMDDWAPTRSLRVPSDGALQDLYLWVLPPRP
jgi:SAM-dependent methyltransferase